MSSSKRSNAFCRKVFSWRATKFALLRALADLAVLKGDIAGAELELNVKEIAKVFIQLYWRQTRPFCASANPRGQVLRQNTGKQASVVRTIASAQAEYGGSLSELQRDQVRWSRLVGEVADTVATMPLWKLQRVGDEVMDFLYPNTGRGRTIRLRPGVAYCLRNFYGILRNLVEGVWVSYVRNQNLEVLGQSTDFGLFLFGAERAPLDVYRPVLMDIQKGECFYCRRPLRWKVVVDHFIPWSRYPVDLAHNFVLVHGACNARKSDYLAAEEHLGAWVERNEQHGEGLRQFFARARLPNSIESSVSITRWAYSQTASMHGLVWVEDAVLRHLGPEWQGILGVG